MIQDDSKSANMDFAKAAAIFRYVGIAAYPDFQEYHPFDLRDVACWTSLNRPNHFQQLVIVLFLHFGSLEWLWRSLTYGKIQKIMKKLLLILPLK